jgi:hypothetical protein
MERLADFRHLSEGKCRPEARELSLSLRAGTNAVVP